jgi:hypothetical protein
MPDRVSVTLTRQPFGFRDRHCQGPPSKCRWLLCDRYELAALRGDGATIRCKAGWAYPPGVASGRPLGSPFCISRAPRTRTGARLGVLIVARGRITCSHDEGQEAARRRRQPVALPEHEARQSEREFYSARPQGSWRSMPQEQARQRTAPLSGPWRHADHRTRHSVNAKRKISAPVFSEPQRASGRTFR